MKLRFSKMHGAGNDYIYVNGFETHLEDPAGLAIPLSDRHKGIGGDGLILVMPSMQADVRMRIFNEDGSEAKMCGNGIRCVGKFAYDNGLVNKTDLTVETASGLRSLKLHLENGRVVSAAVDMGEPILTPRDIPVNDGGDRFVDRPVVVDGKEYRMTCVSMGNPHAVVFLPEVKSLPLWQLGPHFERHPLFPDRVNTEFIRVISPTELEMRVWERGSGETMACGTGACASVVAACLLGHAERGEDVTVRLPGGELIIRWEESGRVMMTGEAVHVFDGEIELPD